MAINDKAAEKMLVKASLLIGTIASLLTIYTYVQERKLRKEFEKHINK